MSTSRTGHSPRETASAVRGVEQQPAGASAAGLRGYEQTGYYRELVCGPAQCVARGLQGRRHAVREQRDMAGDPAAAVTTGYPRAPRAASDLGTRRLTFCAKRSS